MVIGITGSRGFIGRHLVAELNEIGQEIIEFEGDLRQSQDVLSFLARKPDLIFHLAGRVPVYSDGLETMKDYSINLEGTKILVELAKVYRPKIVFSSSIAVYGPHEKLPITEDFEREPVSAYGKSKFDAECLLHEEAERSGLRLAIARFSNVYGPSSNRGTILDNLVDAAICSKRVVVHGSLELRRDFIHVGDAAHALILMGAFEGIFNIGSGRALSIRELISIVEKVSGKRIDVKVFPVEHGQVDIELSVEKAKRILGFEPKVSLDDGIRELLAERRLRGLSGPRIINIYNDQPDYPCTYEEAALGKSHAVASKRILITDGAGFIGSHSRK